MPSLLSVEYSRVTDTLGILRYAVAFPPGFRMISGSPVRRSMDAPLTDNTQWGLSERAVFYSCLRYGDNVQGYGKRFLFVGY